MAPRQQLGDIFLGVTPRPVRDYMRTVLEPLRADYSRLIIPCAGRFTIVEAAVDAGWAPEDIEASDITLFSSLIGYTAARRSLADLAVTFHEEFEPLAAYFDTHPIGAALLAFKLSQLSEKYFEKIVRDELWRSRDDHIKALQAQGEILAKKLDGLNYSLMDCREHIAQHVGDKDTIVYVNPPGFSKGYSKMFDTHGRMTWADPTIPEFEAKTGRSEIYRMVNESPALGFVFRSKEIEKGYEDWAVFAAQIGNRTDYVLCNRPTEVQPLVKHKHETKIKPADLPFLPDDYEITPDTVMQFRETDRGTALYYRDLFAHKLGVTRAERYFLCTLDGYLLAVFGMFFDKVQRGQSGMVLEQFGFCVPSKRYPRINRLFMTAIVCDDARKFFDRCCDGALMPVDYFQTTCISVTPEQKNHRGSLNLTLREVMPDGRFKLVYGGAFKPWGFRQVIINWIEKMAHQQREAKKDLGITDAQIELAKAANKKAA